MKQKWLRIPSEQLRDFGELFDKTPQVTHAASTSKIFDSSSFDGVTYEPKFDATRLRGEMRHVYNVMRHGDWRTIRDIAFETTYSHAGISARLRDLRKVRWGSHTVNRRRRGDPKRGIFEYQLL